MPCEGAAWVRVLDDDDAMRRSWVFLLEGEGWRVRAYADAVEFLSNDDGSEPGCLLLDVRMPTISGLELQEQMLARGIELPIVFISAHGDIDMAVHALKRGACDFLQKPVDDQRLLDAIAAAVARDASRRTRLQESAGERERFETLTAREKDVARWVGAGLPNKLVADRLGISEKTVQVHRGNACRKLGLRSAAEVARLLLAIDEDRLP
ncbi:MAG: response regulator [Burkholderiaceae bacterium]